MDQERTTGRIQVMGLMAVALVWALAGGGPWWVMLQGQEE